MGFRQTLTESADSLGGQSPTYDLEVEDMKKLIPFFPVIFLVSTPATKAVDSPRFTSALQNVALIIAYDADGRPLAVGSAFAVSDDGKLVTNYHVVEGASSATVKFANHDRRFEVSALIHKYPERDLAVIKVRRNTTPLPLGDDRLCGIGEAIYVIGNREGWEGTVSEGVISGYRLLESKSRLMRITAAVSPASRGGPVLNRQGQVVGIASASVVTCVTDLKRLLDSRPVNAAFSPANLPARVSSEPASSRTSRDFVQVIGIKRLASGVAIQLSNGLDKDIRNIKVLVTWRTSEGKELHYSPLLIPELVAARHNKLVQKQNLEGVAELDALRTKADARIIDFEILPSSGSMAFK